MKLKQLTQLMAAGTLVLSTSVFAAGMTFGNNNDPKAQNQAEQPADVDNSVNDSMTESMGGRAGTSIG